MEITVVVYNNNSIRLKMENVRGVIMKKKLLQYYKFKYYFSAKHSMLHDGIGMHPHTFTITLYTKQLTEDSFDVFQKIDSYMECYIKKLSGANLNDLPCFSGQIPTIEVIGQVLFEELREQLKTIELDLMQLDISENPLHIYSISSQLLLCSSHIKNSKRKLERILERKNKYISY